MNRVYINPVMSVSKEKSVRERLILKGFSVGELHPSRTGSCREILRDGESLGFYTPLEAVDKFLK